MKYGLILIIAMMVLAALFVPGAQAGKPKPTAYPPPGGFEAQAYPEPDPSFPFPGTPPPDKAYVWGAYKISGDASWRWYVSKYTEAADPDANIWLCTAQEDVYNQVCYHHYVLSNSLEYIGYQDGMSWYRSIPIAPCGWWGAYPTGTTWNGELMELHQPNWYQVPCTVWGKELYLPTVRR